MKTKEFYFIKCCFWTLLVIILYLLIIAIKYENEAKDALFIAIICVFLDVLIIAFLKSKKRKYIIFKNIIIISGAIFLLFCECCIAIGAPSTLNEDYVDADYILVLGNKLEDGKITDTLEKRLKKAIELHEELGIPVIVSGGNNHVTQPQEALVMKKYLRKYINEDSLILEKQAIDTYENFVYTEKLIGKRKKILIVTSDFHMFRAKYIAKNIGFDRVYGVSAKTEDIMVLYYNLREVISILREGVRITLA